MYITVRDFMKIKQECPKCNSENIIRIPGEVGPYGSGNNITVGATILSAIKVTRYLCGNCGYTEEWIDNKQDIEKLTKKYK